MIFKSVLALFFSVHLVQAQRRTVSGVECVFPLVVDGIEYSDCVTFSGTEYCKTAADIWSRCESNDDSQPSPTLQAFAQLASLQQTPITPISVTPLLVSSAPQQEGSARPPTTSNAALDALIPLDDLPGLSAVSIDLDEAQQPTQVAVETAKVPHGTIRINEVMVGRGRTSLDWVEFVNLGDEVVSIAGWKIRDLNSSSAVGPQTFEIGIGECAEIPGLFDIYPKSYIKFTSKNQCSFPFGFGENDAVFLITEDDQVADFMSWTEADITPGTTFARYPDGELSDIILGDPTPGYSNEPAVGLDLIKSCCSAIQKVGFSSDVPVMIIDTRGRQIPNEPKIDGTFMCTCSGEKETEEDYSGYVGIEIRGHTSARDYAKKSFSMEIRDSSNNDADFPLLGLSSEEDFVLYGPEEDRSLGLKNIMAYELSRQTGRYASDYRIIEVFLVTDGEPLSPTHYHGLYVLGEKPKRDQNRIDIQERAGADFTGGYIMKHDNNNYDEGDYWFNSTLFIEIIIVYPKPEFLMDQEAQYIMDYIAKFESALFGKQYKNKNVGYPAYIDIDSFVDYMLVVEATKNPDGYRGSAYMHKDRSGLLKMGPVWDYNEAFGTCCGYPFEGYLEEGVSDGISGGSAISPEGWRFNICEDQERCVIDPRDGISLWYRRLWKDQAYRERVVQRWQELRKLQISDAWVEARIENFRSQAKAAALRNYQRWGDTIGEEWFGTYEEQWTFYVDRLKEWLLAHMKWMDEEFVKYE